MFGRARSPKTNGHRSRRLAGRVLPWRAQVDELRVELGRLQYELRLAHATRAEVSIDVAEIGLGAGPVSPVMPSFAEAWHQFDANGSSTSDEFFVGSVADQRARRWLLAQR